MAKLEDRRWCTEAEFNALYESRIKPTAIEPFLVCNLAVLLEQPIHANYPGAVYPCYVNDYTPRNKQLTLGIFAIAGEQHDTLLKRHMDHAGNITVADPKALEICGQTAVQACLTIVDSEVERWAHELYDQARIPK